MNKVQVYAHHGPIPSSFLTVTLPELPDPDAPVPLREYWCELAPQWAVDDPGGDAPSYGESGSVEPDQWRWDVGYASAPDLHPRRLPAPARTTRRGVARCALASNSLAPGSNDTAGIAVETGAMSGLSGDGLASLVLLPCPDASCGAVAEILDRITVGSTDGPIEHVKTRCLDGHVSFLPASGVHLPSARPVAAERRLSETGPAG